MNTTRLRSINGLAMAACLLASGTLLGTEIAYFHDPSGNLTNGSLQSTSLPATFVVAGNRTIGIGDALSILLLW